MKKGFSLVELMIVVAVLGILAVIVVPQFQLKTTACIWWAEGEWDLTIGSEARTSQNTTTN